MITSWTPYLSDNFRKIWKQGGVSHALGFFWGGGAGAVVTGAIIPSAGLGLPERYTHADGGVYRGAWAGGRKQGLGTYVYPGGGRYAGEWYNNKKNGRGVYYFPKV